VYIEKDVMIGETISFFIGLILKGALNIMLNKLLFIFSLLKVICYIFN